MEWKLSVDEDMGQQEFHPLLLAPESDMITWENSLALPSQVEDPNLEPSKSISRKFPLLTKEDIGSGER